LSDGTEGLVASELSGVCTLGWLSVALLSLSFIWVSLVLSVILRLTPVSLVIVDALAIPAIRVFLSLLLSVFGVITSISGGRLIRRTIRLFALFLLPVFFGGIVHRFFLGVRTIALLSSWLVLHLEASLNSVCAIRFKGDADFSLSLHGKSIIGHGVIASNRVVVGAVSSILFAEIGPALISWWLIITWHLGLLSFEGLI